MLGWIRSLTPLALGIVLFFLFILAVAAFPLVFIIGVVIWIVVASKPPYRVDPTQDAGQNYGRPWGRDDRHPDGYFPARGKSPPTRQPLPFRESLRRAFIGNRRNKAAAHAAKNATRDIEERNWGDDPNASDEANEATAQFCETAERARKAAVDAHYERDKASARASEGDD
jgi:hypothetical protein